MSRPRLKPLAEQVMLITGASSGIGLATARLAAERGAKVMLVARNGPALAEATEAIRAAGGEADYAIADVGDRTQLAAAADQAVARFGRIDSWVNNAGVAIYGKLVDTPDDEHERLFRTNYFGAVHGATIAIRHLGTRGGALITVASIGSDIPSPLLGAYTASKHAIKGYIESLRIELQEDGVPISVTLIKPSGMATPIGQHAANHMRGEAMIPPPAYDPKLTAEAILNCAEHPRREVTVGGSGRAQVLLGTHFPQLLDRVARLLIPLIEARSQPKTPGDALWAPAEDGRVSPEGQSGLKYSPYTSAALHPVAATAIVAGAAALAYALVRRRRPAG